jgi:serine/threonine protein kinase
MAAGAELGDADETAAVFAEDVETRERLPEGGSASGSMPELLQYSELRIGREIGRGAFSRVYKGRFRGERVAIKKMHIPKGKSLEDKAEQRALRTEIAMLKSMRHPNVLRYHGVAHKGRNVYLVTELLDGGSLAGVLFGGSTALPSNAGALRMVSAEPAHPPLSDDADDADAEEGGGGGAGGGGTEGSGTAPPAAELPWLLRVYLARGAAHGLAYLHEREVVHRDIKTDNLLLAGDWRIVLSDFGFARRKAEEGKAMTICGTDEFMAPEVIWGEEYNLRADVFSFGMVLVELITRKRIAVDGFLQRQARTKFNLDMAELDAAIPDDCPPSLSQCARQCLADDPELRPDATELRDWLDDLWNELSTSQGHDPTAPPDIKFLPASPPLPE